MLFQPLRALPSVTEWNRFFRATNDKFVSGTFTGTLTGCTTSPTTTITYTKANDVIALQIPNFLGTSNTTACTITGGPAVIAPATAQVVVARIRDNSATAFGLVVVQTTGVLTLFVGAAAGTFTASGEKGFVNTTVSYHLK